MEIAATAIDRAELSAVGASAGARDLGRVPVAASLRLDFAACGATGRTILASSEQQAPLKVVRAFSLEDGAALAHLHNVSGGLLGGDQLMLQVNVGAGASVQLTTTGATRIYRPRLDAAETSQTSEIEVGENALLELLPDAVIPYAGARFSQRTRVRLSAGAGLFWWEMLAPGREAHGEVFEYESVEFRTDLIAEGKLIAAERMRLEPRRRSVESIGRLERYRTWATFYICRVGVTAAEWVAIESEMRDALALLHRREDALWSVSALPAHGLVVRCVARRGRDVLAGLHEVWRAAKWRLYGRAAIAPRKVN
jgi:urease accessory protein